MLSHDVNIDYYDFFLKEKIPLSIDEYVFFLPYKNIILLKSGNKIIFVNIESIYFAKGEYKNFISKELKDKIIIVSDYKTASLYLPKETVNSCISIENLSWIKNDKNDFFDFIQGELKREKFFESIEFLSNKFNEIKNLNDSEEIAYKNLLVKDVATNILSNAIVYSNHDMDGLFKKHGKYFVKKIEYSNKRAITGRIMCHDKFNIQNLQNDDERRKFIISRFEGGYLVDFDYTSFETTLSMYLTGDRDFIEKFSDKDFHEEVAKIIYDKNNIDSDERSFAKSVTHPVVYGAGKNTVIEIIKDFENKEDIYDEIMKFLSPILKKAKELKEEFENNGYIKNYFGSIIYPQKSYALYNNYIQSSAADIIARKIISVNNILIPYKSKIITAVHDNIIVDMSPDEWFLIDIIEKEMESVLDLKFSLTKEKRPNLFN
jgi:hypothetical protein